MLTKAVLVDLPFLLKSDVCTVFFIISLRFASFCVNELLKCFLSEFFFIRIDHVSNFMLIGI